MFERRLRLLLIILAVPVAALILRLVQLQIVHARIYQAGNEELLYRPPRFFPFVRGAITDRTQIRLAYDAPAWQICFRYGVLAEDKDYLGLLENGLTDPGEDIHDKIEESFLAVQNLARVPVDDLKKQGRRIVGRVDRVRKYLSAYYGRPIEIEEELPDYLHPIVTGLDQRQMVEARERLTAYPWIEVSPGYTRKYAGGEEVGHLIGELREVGPEDLKNDPHKDDPLTCYKAGELRGVSGIEALGEQWLRGRRGCEQLDLAGRPLTEKVEPQDGKNFRLTLDLQLQQYIYERLMEVVEPNSVTAGGTVTGASAVLLDIPARQVLALVSYPSFDPNASPEELQFLEQDKLRRPRLFRALRQHYPPGSTVKPMVLACALTDGKVRPGERITCHKYMFAEVLDRWRCLYPHGDVDPVTAIKKSCNIFFYHTGERMGVRALADWMSQFGLGSPSGIGLFEAGVLPTKGGRGDARRMAIGQYLDVTPLQAANMVATIASGEFRPVTIWADDPRARAAQRLKIPQKYWDIVREGMYKVVNEQGGTAFGPQKADFDNDPEYVLLGKTGSAQIQGREQTHAWFVGYLAPRRSYLNDTGDSDMNIALAVIIEFGGHGGAVASPVAGDIVRFVVNRHCGIVVDDQQAGGTQ